MTRENGELPTQDIDELGTLLINLDLENSNKKEKNVPNEKVQSLESKVNSSKLESNDKPEKSFKSLVIDDKVENKKTSFEENKWRQNFSESESSSDDEENVSKNYESRGIMTKNVANNRFTPIGRNGGKNYDRPICENYDGFQSLNWVPESVVTHPKDLCSQEPLWDQDATGLSNYGFDQQHWSQNYVKPGHVNDNDDFFINYAQDHELPDMKTLTFSNTPYKTKNETLLPSYTEACEASNPVISSCFNSHPFPSPPHSVSPTLVPILKDDVEFSGIESAFGDENNSKIFEETVIDIINEVNHNYDPDLGGCATETELARLRSVLDENAESRAEADVTQVTEKDEVPSPEATFSPLTPPFTPPSPVPQDATLDAVYITTNNHYLGNILNGIEVNPEELDIYLNESNDTFVGNFC